MKTAEKHNVTPASMIFKRGKGRPVGVIATGLCAKAWRAIRLLSADNPNFTLGDILDLVATGGEKDAPNNLIKYLGHLERFGVVTRLDRRAPSLAKNKRGAVIWCLIRDLGWYPPVWRTAQQVLWDPNAKTVVTLPAPQTLPTPQAEPTQQTGVPA
jgi:hypothetical protein